MWLATITGVGLGLALRTGFHWLIRRGLRAPRVPHHTEPMALGLSAETVFITSKNQKQLFAWWLPCADQPRPTLLVMHGWVIDGGVWYFDVGSSHPGAEVGPKGMVVCHLKWYVSWV